MRSIVIRGVSGSVLITVGRWLFAKISGHMWVNGVPDLHSVRVSPHHLGPGLTPSFVDSAFLTWSWRQTQVGVMEQRDGLARVRWAAGAGIVPTDISQERARP